MKRKYNLCWMCWLTQIHTPLPGPKARVRVMKTEKSCWSRCCCWLRTTSSRIHRRFRMPPRAVYARWSWTISQATLGEDNRPPPELVVQSASVLIQQTPNCHPLAIVIASAPYRDCPEALHRIAMCMEKEQGDVRRWVSWMRLCTSALHTNNEPTRACTTLASHYTRQT